LSGHFSQILRYTSFSNTRSTTVRLRLEKTVSLAFEINPSLKRDVIGRDIKLRQELALLKIVVLVFLINQKDYEL
jgi:hypothetical protein